MSGEEIRVVVVGASQLVLPALAAPLRQAQPQPSNPSKLTELEMASQLARNTEASPPNSQEEVSDFFPCKQHFLDLLGNNSNAFMLLSLGFSLCVCVEL